MSTKPLWMSETGRNITVLGRSVTGSLQRVTAGYVRHTRTWTGACTDKRTHTRIHIHTDEEVSAAGLVDPVHSCCPHWYVPLSLLWLLLMTSCIIQLCPLSSREIKKSRKIPNLYRHAKSSRRPQGEVNVPLTIFFVHTVCICWWHVLLCKCVMICQILYGHNGRKSPRSF